MKRVVFLTAVFNEVFICKPCSVCNWQLKRQLTGILVHGVWCVVGYRTHMLQVAVLLFLLL